MSQQCTESTRGTYCLQTKYKADDGRSCTNTSAINATAYAICSYWVKKDAKVKKKRMELEKNVVSLASGHDPMNIHSSWFNAETKEAANNYRPWHPLSFYNIIHVHELWDPKDELQLREINKHFLLVALQSSNYKI